MNGAGRHLVSRLYRRFVPRGRRCFSDAVPVRRDRRSLRRQLRRTIRATKSEQKAATTAALERLAAGRVLVTRVTTAPNGDDRVIDFADGTSLRLELREGSHVLHNLIRRASYNHVRVAWSQPCFGGSWFRLRLASIETGETAEILAKVSPSIGNVPGTAPPRPRKKRRPLQGQ